jgi:hypothetical protein
MARARVAKPGQRRKVEGLVTQVFEGSNPFPRIVLFSICQFGMKITFFRLKGFRDRWTISHHIWGVILTRDDLGRGDHKGYGTTP